MRFSECNPHENLTEKITIFQQDFGFCGLLSVLLDSAGWGFAPGTTIGAFSAARPSIAGRGCLVNGEMKGGGGARGTWKGQTLTIFVMDQCH